MKALFGALLELGFLVFVAPLLLGFELCALWATDVVGLFRGLRPVEDAAAETKQVSVVIPTWNGRHHLEANLASVVEAVSRYPGSEIIVVENASDDGTAEYLGERFPDVVCLAQSENLGFGGGSNAGFRAAKNDIVVLLNNDMRVTPDFLAPLLAPFEGDDKVFAVSAQIFFSDPEKRREETGLTAGRWTQGRLALGHVIDDTVDRAFPSFYAGGGSTAYDRRKFLEVGGFDELLRPFYMEDADVSYLAWKRGWKVLYAPDSRVFHEHRGTIGKHFSEDDIQRIVHKNNLLFIWKNIHEPGRLAGHFGWTWLALLARFLAGPSPMRPDARAFLQALRQTPETCGARLRARALARVGDAEALRRPLGGYFRDVFGDLPANPKDLNVLFFSPYSMSPPIHGGGVFMSQTVERLAATCRLHLFCLVDAESEVAGNRAFAEGCASAEIIVRWRDHSHAKSVLRPYAAQHFYHPELEWKLHRSICLREIDAVQFEYTQLAVYAPRFRRIGSFLFEHDVYFQSVSRGWDGATGAVAGAKRFYEYLRALRFERRAVSASTRYRFAPRRIARISRAIAWNSPPLYEGLRAGIDVAALRVQRRRPRARHAAVRRQLQAPAQPRGARVVRRERAAAGKAQAIAGEVGRRRRSGPRRLRRSLEASRRRVCGRGRRDPRAAGALCRFRGADPDRLGSAGQTARGLRRRHPGRLDRHRSRGHCSGRGALPRIGERRPRLRRRRRQTADEAG